MSVYRSQLVLQPEKLQRNVVWLGDMNYRIALDNETVRALAEVDDLDPLIASDQVKIMLPSMFKIWHLTVQCS